MRLFLSFLKIGSVVFGSGYVLLAFLQTEFVEHLRWLTDKQLIDAVAVGRFTPGPLFTTATFIGYLVAGWMGAVVATLGIFLPGFVLVAVSGPLIPRLRRSPMASATLDGVVAGSLALIAVVAWQLGRASVVNWTTLIVFALSLIALLRFRVNSGVGGGRGGRARGLASAVVAKFRSEGNGYMRIRTANEIWHASPKSKTTMS